MRVVWTAEALADLEEILVYYHREAGSATAGAVGQRVISQIVGLRAFPERIRASDRIPGARELVIGKLPCIACVQVNADTIIVLNVIHMAGKFPA